MVFVIIALWAASKAQFAIMHITNYTFAEGESTGKASPKSDAKGILASELLLMRRLPAYEQILEFRISLVCYLP